MSCADTSATNAINNAELRGTDDLGVELCDTENFRVVVLTEVYFEFSGCRNKGYQAFARATTPSRRGSSSVRRQPSGFELPGRHKSRPPLPGVRVNLMSYDAVRLTGTICIASF